MLEVRWWGSLRDLSKNILKQGVGKGKSCSYGGGDFEGVTTPAPPENFNRTPWGLKSFTSFLRVPLSFRTESSHCA